MKLYKYQEVDATWMAQHYHCLNASEMGTGKTAVMIRAAKVCKAKHILVVCPAIARAVWKDEIQLWWPKAATSTILKASEAARVLKAGTEVKFFIVSYDMFSRGNGLDPFYSKNWDLVICDEAHYLKGHMSKRTQNVFMLHGNTKRMWLATGTPSVNNYGDVFPMFFYLWPKTMAKFNLNSYAGWIGRFCRTTDMNIGGRMINVIVGSKNGIQLKSMLKDVMIRRKKAAVLSQLPPISHISLPFDFDVPVILRPPTGDGVGKVSDDKFLAVAAMPATERRHLGDVKADACLPWIQEFLDVNHGKKLVIFAHHRDVVDKLYKLLAEYDPVKIVGGQDDYSRVQAQIKFKTDPKCRVFIGSITACGTAITLTAAHTVLFVESDWNPATNNQAAARCHRIGQPSHVDAYYASLTGCPFDERLTRILVRKAAEFQEVYDA